MIGARLAAFSQSGRAFAPPVIGIQFASALAIPSLVFTSGAAIAAVTPVVFSGGVMPYSITVSPLIPGLTIRSSDGQINAGTAGAVTASATYRFTGVDALSNTTFKDVTITIAAAGGGGTIITAQQWSEIATQAAAWGDTNNAKARVDALPTTGTNVSAGANLATAIAGVANGGSLLLGSGVYTPTGSLLSLPSAKKMVAAPGASPIIDLSQLTNFACVYIGNGSVLANIEFRNPKGIAIITFDTVAAVYSNAGTTGLIYNCKVHDSGRTGAQTDGTGISITGGDQLDAQGNFIRGLNWCVVANEVYNCWNPGGSAPTGNGGNSDGIAYHFDSAFTTSIGNYSHNNGDDGFDMWHGGQVWSYFDTGSHNAQVPGVTNGGDGNGFKLGTGNVAHKFYKPTAQSNSDGGFNLNANLQQPIIIQPTVGGNANGDFMNGVIYP